MDIQSLRSSISAIIPLLSKQRYKGQNGKVCVIGGSLEYTGAPYFSAISSLKGGGDVAHIICTKQSAIPIKSYSPECIVHPLLVSSQEADYEKVDLELILAKTFEWLPPMHSFIVGPGLGRDKLISKQLQQIIPKISKPIVIDADGLWYLLLEDINFIDIIKQQSKNVVLTPNQGEFTRLQKFLKLETVIIEDEEMFNFTNNCKTHNFETDVNGKIVANAVNLSKALNNIVVIQKGQVFDIITNGEQAYIVSQPGSMKRCGGIGDILSGLTGLYISWCLQANQSALIGCVLSSIVTRKAGYKAFRKLSYSLTCSDIIKFIGDAFQDTLIEFEIQSQKL